MMQILFYSMSHLVHFYMFLVILVTVACCLCEIVYKNRIQILWLELKQFIALGSLGLIASLDRQCKWKTFIHLFATFNNTHRDSDEGDWKRKTNNTQRTTTIIHYGSTTRMKNGLSSTGWCCFNSDWDVMINVSFYCVVLRKVMTVSCFFFLSVLFGYTKAQLFF